MKKILFICHAQGWGGAPNSMIQLINSLDSLQYDVVVLLLKNSIVAERLAENKIKFKVADSIFYRKYYHYFTHSEAGYVKWFQIFRFTKLGLFWLLSRYYFAKKELEKHEFDIAHLNSSVLTDWLSPSKKKGKVIIHIREPYRKGKFDVLHPFFTSQIRKYADQIIAISKDNSKRINIPEKTEVIYNYAEISKTFPSESSYSSKKVLYLGGASYIKGFYTLVKALDYLDKDVKVYFGGTYAVSRSSKNIIKRILKFITCYRKKQKAAIKKMQMHPNAIVLGMIHEVDKYLNEVCCLVSPFTVTHFSRPIIEAFARRKPAIASRIKGIEEMIDDGKNGILVEAGDAKSLSDAINFLCNHPKISKKMGDNGYEVAKNKYSQKNIRYINEIYENLFEGKYGNGNCG